MARAPYDVYDIAPGATYREAAQSSLRHQFDEMMHNLPGTRDGNDIEALHDMRVASRRLRSALSVFAAAFAPKPFAALEKQVAQVTDALGMVRDADVQIEFMEAQRDKAPDSEKIGLDAFLDHLRAQRDKDRVILVKALNRLEKSSFAKDFDHLLQEAAHG